MAVLGIGVADSMQRHNATKNVLALVVNLIAAIVFVFLAYVDVPYVPDGGTGTVNWGAAGLIAIGQWSADRSARRWVAGSRPTCCVP